MEEAWLLHFHKEEIVQLHIFFETPAAWRNEALVEKWNRIRALRRVVTGALEIERAKKNIGASLEAAPVLYLRDKKDVDLFEGVDLAEITITSKADVIQDSRTNPLKDSGTPDTIQFLPGKGIAWDSELFTLMDVPDAAAQFRHAEGHKCARCWMILPEVGADPAHPDLCNRCAEAVDALPKGAA